MSDEAHFQQEPVFAHQMLSFVPPANFSKISHTLNQIAREKYNSGI